MKLRNGSFIRCLELNLETFKNNKWKMSIVDKGVGIVEDGAITIDEAIESGNDYTGKNGNDKSCPWKLKTKNSDFFI